ncbi:Uncharacterised protein [Anaerostipes hadrus]|uniref:Uncharacterized protein n=1 Tax=Anaerostipes hadrus TaxID=649756 RepID=A0A174TJG1_ANAHA|nr:hypothetical protein [Anaerostipes hadrus]CUQ07029.1 Uncharacterised protein [Anaerostipes hadrus]
MHIEKIEHDNCVETKLDAEEVICLCEVLYGAYYDNEDNPVFSKLYSELIIARDICLYGHLDDFAIANVVSCGDIKKISEQAKEIDQTRKEEA